MTLKKDIILIGPIGVGKTTVSTLLAAQLKIPRRPLDDLRWNYYTELGFDKDYYEALGSNIGTWASYRYGKPFEIHAVERVLRDYQECIFDFGGGNSVYEEETHFTRAQYALQEYANVVLLLPSPDLDESVALLRAGVWDGRGREIDFHEHFVKHPSNHNLAKHVIYTKGKTPRQTCADVLEAVGHKR